MEEQTRIPKEGIIKTIIESAVETRQVGSQTELADFVRQKLSEGDSSYRISSRRARLIALEIPDMVIHIETKNGEIPDRCPCCSGSLDSVFIRNLRGEKVLDSLRCSSCPYEGRKNKWMPRRYTFSKGGIRHAQTG